MRYGYVYPRYDFDLELTGMRCVGQLTLEQCAFMETCTRESNLALVGVDRPGVRTRALIFVVCKI